MKNFESTYTTKLTASYRATLTASADACYKRESIALLLMVCNGWDAAACRKHLKEHCVAATNAATAAGLRGMLSHEVAAVDAYRQEQKCINFMNLIDFASCKLDKIVNDLSQHLKAQHVTYNAMRKAESRDSKKQTPQDIIFAAFEKLSIKDSRALLDALLKKQEKLESTAQEITAQKAKENRVKAAAKARAAAKKAKVKKAA